MSTELSEVKKSFEELQKTVVEMKQVNDARLEAIAKGHGSSDFDEKLDRINDAIRAEEKVQREWRKRQEEAEAKRVADEVEWKTRREQDERKFEARMNRAALGLGGAGADESKGSVIMERKAFSNFLRNRELSADERKVLTVSNDTTGGYLAPPTYLAEIIKASVLFSPMRNLVTVRNISTGELQQPKRTTSAAATWMSEIGTRSETTNPAWGMMKIPAHELYAEARVSMANIEDSAFNLDEQLQQEFSEQFGVSEGAAVISGTGAGKPLGFLDANAAGPSTPIAYTVSGSAATIAGASGSMADGLVNMYHALKSPYALGASWGLNRGSLGKVRLLKDTTGQYLWLPGIAMGAPPTILGAPYTELPDMPDEGAGTFPIVLADWKRAYVIVDRIEMSVTRDPFTVASSGQIKFSARRRVGGQVVLGEAMRLLKCST